jgi:hypothetical protein
MPLDNNTLINSIQAPAPPQNEAFSLPALLTAIGSLGLNIGGAVSGHGDVGASSLSLSQQLQNDAERTQKQKYADELRATGQQQKRNAGGAIAKRLPEVSNPAARLQIQTLIANDDPETANSVLYKEIGEQDRRKATVKDDYNKVQGGLNDFIKEKTQTVAQIQKALPPEVHQALAEQEFFSAQAKPLSSVAELREKWNQRKDAKKINDSEAAQLYNKYTSVVNSARPAKFGSDFLGKTMGFGDDPKSTDAFKDYAKSTLSPETLQAATQGTSQIQQHMTQAQKALQIKQTMANPKTKAKGIQMAEEFLAAGGSAPSTQQAPPAGQRMFSKSENRYYIKKPNGDIVPE